MEQKVCKSSANHIAQLHYDPDENLMAITGQKKFTKLVLGVSYLVDGTKSHSDMKFP